MGKMADYVAAEMAEYATLIRPTALRMAVLLPQFQRHSLRIADRPRPVVEHHVAHQRRASPVTAPAWSAHPRAGRSRSRCSRSPRRRCGRDARCQAEAAARAVEIEQAAVGDQRDRAAGAEDVVGAAARRADEIDFRHHRAARVLDAEQDHARHHEIQIGRAERAGERAFGSL